MATATLRPSSVIYNDDWVTGGSGLPYEIADGSDAGFTRHTSEGGYAEASFGMPTVSWLLPTQINSVTFFARWRGWVQPDYAQNLALHSRNGGSTRQELARTTPADSPNHGVTFQDQTGATTTSPSGAGWTTSTIDSLELVIASSGGAAGWPVYGDIFDIWAVVDYTVLYNAPATATVTGPVGLTSTLPTVTWTYFDAEGSAQEGAWVRVFRRPAAGWGSLDPETNTVDRLWSNHANGTSTSRQLGTALKRGVDYRAYVKVAEVNYGSRYGFWSPGPDFKADGSAWGGIKQ